MEFGGFALSCLTIGILFGRLFWGWLADKIKSSKVVLALCGITMGLMTIALAQVTLDFPEACVLGIAFVLGFCSNGWAGVFFAQVAANSPANKVSEATGGADFFMFMGAIFISMGFGFLATYLNKDFQLPFYIMSAATILTGFLLFFLKGTKVKDESGTPVPQHRRDKEEQ
ncbi:MAG: MFS transporter [Burkholderiales bacterium]|nr:MFS transporter [Burkholderiales bacterium]